MKCRAYIGIAAVVLASALPGAVPVAAAASDAAALTGTVRSAQEGRMEGVVVTARRDGATFTVSVVTDARGRFSFPRTHLDPGSYALDIRAAGYDLSAPATVGVTSGKTATLDLTLQPAKDLASQLSTLEWITSMPGTQEQKNALVYQSVSCAYCHTYERILKSKHTAEQFVTVISRMQTYFGDGTASSRSGRGRGQRNDLTIDETMKNPNWATAKKRDLADYLASVNVSGGRTTWPFELKTLPRPKGAATRVIVTQYDLPRKDTVPHDMTIDSRGIPWYPDQSRMVIGKLDPRTGTATEYPLPALPEGRYGGVADMTPDRDDNIWFTMTVPDVKTHFGWPVKFDRKTERISVVSLPNSGQAQFLERSPLDGRIWLGYGIDMYRVDPALMKVDAHLDTTPKDGGPAGGRHFVYQVVVDSRGNPWGCDFPPSAIVGVDAATGKVKSFPTPTKDAFPRRGRMDKDDRFWFGEYFGDRIGMLDTRAEKIQEWPMPYKYTTPYTASVPDSKGRVYAPSNTAERLIQLDPKTGRIVQFQMPTDFDTKKIVYDPTTTRPVLWMANTRNARLVRVEPLD